MKNYGQIIAKLRKEKGFTQEQLGKKLNVSYQAVSKWENNLSEPDLGTLEKLVKIFGITMSEFFAMANQGNYAVQGSSNIAMPACDVSNEQYIVKSNTGKKINFDLPKMLKTKPWYVVAGLGVLVAVFALFAILIPFSLSSEQIYSNVSPSVFYVTTYNSNDYASTSSGFFVNISGLAVTTYSVVKNAVRGEITLDNQTYQIERLVKIDEKLDLALIKINIDWSPTVKLGNSNSVGLAHKVYAIGSKAKNETYLSESLISKISYSGDYKYFQLLTTSVTNGSVLVNETGRVVGIFTWAFYGDAGMDTAVPINAINQMPKNINMSLEEFQKARKTFSFYSNGKLIESQEFINGDKITKIQDPTREGYSFGGWYTEEDYQTEFDFNSPVVDQTECYAKWLPNAYTIKFETNGGTGTMQDMIVNYDQELSLPTSTFEKAHYKVAKWQQKDTETFFDNNQTIKNLTTENNAVIVLCAIWEEISYTIAFDGNGATGGEMDDFVLQWGQSQQLPNNLFYKTGYLFDSWLYNGITYYQTDFVYNLCETEATVTFVAQWEPITYTICFSYMGLAYYQTMQYDMPAKLLPNTYERENHYFASWYCSTISPKVRFYDQEEVVNLTTKNRDILTFDAELEENYYYIRYHSLNSDNQPTENIQKLTYTQDGFIYNENDRFNYGYMFTHWEDKDGNIYNAGDWVYSLLEGVGNYLDLYAQWQETTYTVMYRLIYKEETIATQIWGTKTFYEQFALIDCPFELDGYVFDHYEAYEMTFLKEFYPGDVVSKLTRDNNRIKYIDAIFIPKQYTIIFDGNGASSGNMENQTATYETEVVLNTNQFVKNDYVFVGWDYNGITIGDAQTITKLTTKYEETITLTAIWSKGMLGEGTQESPYLIEDFNDYRQLVLTCKDSGKSTWGKYYKFTNDIDFDGKHFEQIKYFEGDIDGDGHVLKNITFANADCVGLIARSNWTTITNLGIENFTCKMDSQISEIMFAGAFVARAERIKLQNCYATGTFDFKSVSTLYCGGLIGYAYYNWGMIRSYSAVDITVVSGNVVYAGGIMGYSYERGTYKECYSACNITATINQKCYTAGIVGFVPDIYASANIQNCFVVANIKISLATAGIYEYCYMGDLICDNDSSQLTNNYTSLLSVFSFVTAGQVPTIYLFGTSIEDNSLKNETFIKENIFIDVSDAWVLEASQYPRLAVFTKE